MAKQKQKPEVSKSEEVRNLLQANPAVTAKEVIATLGKKGISVTDSLYYIVKGKMKLKKLRKAKAATAVTSENGSAKPVKAPASADKPNKSQAVRGLLTENPKLSVDEVISTMTAKGIEVKRGLIYLVKSDMKSKKRRQAKEEVATEMVTATKKTVSASTSSNGATDALATIKQVKGLAAELGGMKSLKALVDALSE